MIWFFVAVLVLIAGALGYIIMMSGLSAIRGRGTRFDCKTAWYVSAITFVAFVFVGWLAWSLAKVAIA
jgi:hypothetical protein